MIILGLRTDKPEAELYLLNNEGEVGRIFWQAHRQLSDTLLKKIDELLLAHDCTQADLEGLVVYKGPGSFTGLRIGIAVANAMAYSLKLPVVGSEGDGWLENGLSLLKAGQNDTQVVPVYGQDPHITKQRK